MTPAPTMVFMKLNDALDTELSPPPSPVPAASASVELSEATFKGDSSSCAAASDTSVSSRTPAFPLSSNVAMSARASGKTQTFFDKSRCGNKETSAIGLLLSANGMAAMLQAISLCCACSLQLPLDARLLRCEMSCA